MTFHPDNLPDLTGKTYIVTGGTSGIGFCTVARLAQHGAHVYLCARSEAKGAKAAKEIKDLYGDVNIGILVMDHNSLSSVNAAANVFLSKETALHGLVNNAGIMATPYEMTADGYEIQWQTNHVAHWLFTERLLPLLLETSKNSPRGTVRIVDLTSGGHMMAPKPGINFADTSLRDDTALARYGQSKLANVLHCKILHKKYGPGSKSAKSGEGEVWTSVIHPGIVQTNLASKASEAPWLLLASTWVVQRVGGVWPSDKGAWTNVFCVASPEMKPEQSGTYFERIAKPGWESSKAKNIKLAEELDDWTRAEMKKKGFL